MISKKQKLSQKTENNVLKTKFDNSNFGTILITAPDSLVLYANKKIQDKTGFSAGEVVGKKPGQLWGGHMDKSFYKKMWQTIGQEKRPFIASVENLKKDGSPFLELVHIAPVLDSSGSVKFFIEISPAVQSAAFANDFSRAFSSQENDEAIKFFFKLFSIPAFAFVKNQVKGAESGLENFLEEVFVGPSRAQYRKRFEDNELIHLAQADKVSFDKLYQKYVAQVKHYFLTRTEPALADDLTQETFLQAFKYLPKFTVSNASYLTYLLRIAHNILAGYYRNKAHNPVTYDVSLLENMPTDSVDHAKIWDMEKLWNAVHDMSEIEQKVVTLKYHEDKPVRDIALQLGKTENAIKLILSRTRKKLRHTLAKL